MATRQGHVSLKEKVNELATSYTSFLVPQPSEQKPN